MQAREHLGVHAGHAVRRFAQAFAVGVLADGQQDFADGGANSFLINGICHGVFRLFSGRKRGVSSLYSYRRSGTVESENVNSGAAALARC